MSEEILIKSEIAVIMYGKNELINFDNAMFMNRCGYPFLYVDSGSTDGTIDSLKKEKITYIETSFVNWPLLRDIGYKWCEEKSIKWFIILDADERIGYKDIKKLDKMEKTEDAYWCAFDFHFNGNKMNFGGHRNRIRFVSVKNSKVSGDTKTEWVDAKRIGITQPIIRIVNNDLHDFSSIIEKQAQKARLSVNINVNNISTEHSLVKQIFLSSISRFPIIKGFLYFIYHYFFRLAILDGKTGFLFCIANAFIFNICEAAMQNGNIAPKSK